ncbi:hypothetical protein [Diaphorobacter caeni]|uniref:hypothetical protein n=1 Tax=Diaphorobacter caeni TaxID=2784387 RepID=UPI00188FA89C|nr:hypothetical protein [Diaphorobacter caeni]MBF5006873.1 hypothetical protein [Diaphorobacter caeni]
MRASVETAIVRRAGEQGSELTQVFVVDFGEAAIPLPISDAHRELLIQIEGMHLHMSLWSTTKDEHEEYEARRHQDRMYELIKGRSLEMQARIAAEKGLPHA